MYSKSYRTFSCFSFPVSWHYWAIATLIENFGSDYDFFFTSRIFTLLSSIKSSFLFAEPIGVSCGGRGFFSRVSLTVLALRRVYTGDNHWQPDCMISDC